MPKPPQSDLEALEAAAALASTGSYVLHLVVSGHSPHSAAALINVRRFCEANLPGRYQLRLTNVRKHPELAKALEIFATPTLIRESPLPLRRFIGNMERLDALLAPPDRLRPGRRAGHEAQRDESARDRSNHGGKTKP